MTEPTAPDVLCIGAVLWDIIGRAETVMKPGSDIPGRITRVPGGVAMNLALTLRRFGFAPALLTALGLDPAGDELVKVCQRLGIDASHALRSPELPTDQYLAIEDASGLLAGIADARSLEAAGAAILAPLTDGRLGSIGAPWQGLITLDGNLTEELLAEIASLPFFLAADLRVVPASTGKVKRLRPLLGHPRVTLYLNLEEAGILCGTRFEDSETAAVALLELGTKRVLVTNGGRDATDAKSGEDPVTASPPPVQVKRVTGAGDTFMAAHIAAEHAGYSREIALGSALQAAALYVSGEIGS